jgi:hypothetical protein
VRPLVPWTQRYVAAQAARHHLGIDDLWDEALTALLRVSLYADFVSGNATGGIHPRMHYAQTAVRRACWRYVVRRALKHPPMVCLDLVHSAVAPSVEEELLAREALLAEDAAAARAPMPRLPCSTPNAARAPRALADSRRATRAG